MGRVETVFVKSTRVLKGVVGGRVVVLKLNLTAGDRPRFAVLKDGIIGERMVTKKKRCLKTR